MVTILIADDHAIVRDGLKQILARTGDLLVGGEARDGHDVVRLVRDREWDLLLMDMSMPGRNGIELIKQVKAEKPKLPILILSMHGIRSPRQNVTSTGKPLGGIMLKTSRSFGH